MKNRLVSSRLVSRVASVGLVAVVVGAFHCSSSEPDVRGDSCVLTQAKETQGVHQSRTVGRATQTTDIDVGASSTNEHVVLAVDGALYMDIRLHTSGPASEAHVQFGRFFHGMSVADFRSTDGVLFDGTLDGHELATFKRGESPRRRDGGAIDVTLDEGAKAAVAGLSSNASAGAGCTSAAAAPDSHALVGGGYSNPGQFSDTRGSVECLLLEASCGVAFVGCSAAVFVGCAGVILPFAYVACVVVGLFTCAAIDLGCLIGANSGAPCCPIACGSRCCFASESCLDNSKGLCCGTGTTFCHSTTGSGDENCCKGTDTCLPDGTCCATGQAVCDGTCCAPGSLCETVPATGQKACTPCPSFRQCGTTCCGSTERCVNPNTGSCCSAQPFVPTCLGNCCNAPTDKCTGSLSDTCCADAQACGDKCCPVTQGCDGQNCLQCTGSQPLCHPPTGPNRCCDIGSLCDQNGCCAAGQILCGTPAACTSVPIGAACP